MIMNAVYLGIAALVLALSLWCLFTERAVRWQLNAALIVIPLLLRILRIA